MAFMKNMSPHHHDFESCRLCTGLAHAQREHMNLTHTYTAEFLSVRNPVRDILGMNNLDEFPTVILSL